MKLFSLTTAFFMLLGAFAFNSNGTSAEEKVYKIGDRGPGGGWIFYDKGSNSEGWRYLEAAKEDQSTGTIWGCYSKSITGAAGKAIGTGKGNTSAIMKLCSDPRAAAIIADAYRGGGKNDWFLPSREELLLMYENLFKAGIGSFSAEDYWSSSEYNADAALLWAFGEDTGDFPGKDFKARVRAVRSF